MKSFAEINLNQDNVEWKIGLDKYDLKMIDENNYVYEDWTSGEDLWIYASVDGLILPESYEKLCSEGRVKVGFSLEWYCKETSLRGKIEKKEIDVSPEQIYILGGTIPGDRIGGQIDLSLNMVVLESYEPDIVGKGLRLGQVETTVIIEANRAQFPTMIISFSKEPPFKPYKNALYKLARDITCSNLEDLFYNSYMLYLNSDSPYVDILNRETEAGTPERAVMNMLITSIYSDIIFDIANYFSKKDIKLSEWIKPVNGTKKIPEMLGSVYFNIVCMIDNAMNKHNVDSTLNYITAHPEEACLYLQSSIFQEAK